MSRIDYRPGYHFTPDRNWMNDPNGLVYHKGIYHLFFQYNPHGDEWANMSWGHASSDDLVRWREHPVAIPMTDDEQIFSGSVVVDHHNSAGFGVAGEPPLVAVYTSAYADGLQAQSLAFSTDDGATWAKYAGNPVLDRVSAAFRDPRVFWYQSPVGSGYWVMAAVEAEAREVLFYRSDDLKAWSHLSTFAGASGTGALGGQEFWECPDLFPLPVDGDADRVMWALVISVNPDTRDGGSATRYLLGQFDGTSFSPLSAEAPRRLDCGADFYAATSFANVPEGRRIAMGWMSNWAYGALVPTSPWRGTMSIPRELSLVAVDGRTTLVQQPVAELQTAEHTSKQVDSGPFTLDGTHEFTSGQQYRADITFDAITARQFGLDVLVGDGEATQIRYDPAGERLSVDRSRSGDTAFHPLFPSTEHAAVPLADGTLHLQVLVDRTSVEVFAQHGAIGLTTLVFPGATSTRLRLVSLGGPTCVTSLRYIPLRSPVTSGAADPAR